MSEEKKYMEENILEKIKEKKQELITYSPNILIRRDTDLYEINDGHSEDIQNKARMILSTFLAWNMNNEINETGLEELIKVIPKIGSDLIEIKINIDNEIDKKLIINYLEVMILENKEKEPTFTKKVEIINTMDTLLPLCEEFNNKSKDKIKDLEQNFINEINSIEQKNSI